MKTNNGCATNFIVTDNKNVDKPSVVRALDIALNKPYGDLTGQRHYGLIKPCIIAEKLMRQDEGHTSLTDYKFECVNGRPMACVVITDRRGHFDMNIQMYTPRWQKIEPYSSLHSVSEDAPVSAYCPKNWNEMVEIARKLSQGHEFVRIDLYNIAGKFISVKLH